MILSRYRYSRCFRSLLASASAAVLTMSAARAQWQSTTYDLQPGWNSVWLPGNADYQEIDTLLLQINASAAIDEIWRWNPNPDKFQFTTQPGVPSASAPEWFYWKKAPAGAPPLSTNTLRRLIGQSAYLIKAGTAHQLTLVQRPLAPGVVWQRAGANFLGFPSSKVSGQYPTFAQYFASFPPAVASGVKVYKYIGGELGTSNPLQIGSLSTERVDPAQAYWFDTQAVGDFYAPVDISTSTISGLDYGRTGSLVTLRLRNRTSATVSLTITPEDSRPAPQGQPGIKGRAPLAVRVLKPATGTYVTTSITGAITQSVPAQGTSSVDLVLERGRMSGNPADTYAALLKVRDSSNLFDITLPVSASVGSLAGLWMGDALVNQVESKVPGKPGSGTPAPFPLRILVHVDDAGKATLLSQVFLGVLRAAPNDRGICTVESLLKQDEKASAQRLVATHLPTGTTALSTTAASPGATLSFGVKIPFDASSNPFVHQYHPDHDNMDARFTGKLPDGVVNTATAESWTIQRNISLTISATPPAGVSSVGYGDSVIAGTYTESLTGLRKNGHADPAQRTLNTSGTFSLRRISELGSILTK